VPEKVIVQCLNNIHLCFLSTAYPLEKKNNSTYVNLNISDIEVFYITVYHHFLVAKKEHISDVH
jgi:hypothetical protein